MFGDLFGLWKQHTLNLVVLFWHVCQVTDKADSFEWVSARERPETEFS